MSMGLVPESSPEMKEPFCVHRTVETLKSRQLRIVRVEVLLVLLACSLIFVGVFGAFRRRYRSRAFALVGFVIHTLSIPTVTYTLGLMQDATFCNQLFPFGAAFLVVVLGGADSYIADSLEDIAQWKSFNIESAIKCGVVGSLIGSYVPTSKLMLVAVCLMVLVYVKVYGRARALMSASKYLMQRTFNPLADYMSMEHRESTEANPSTMIGYKYLVSGAGKIKAHLRLSSRRDEVVEPEYEISLPDDVITIEKVWNCPGELLRGGDPHDQLKDLCLSFSLFKLICLRFADYSLPPEAHKKLWSLIEHLLSKENGYMRVFRVIEVELAFLFDQFYTDFLVTLSPFHIVMKVLQLFTMVAFFMATISSYLKSQNESIWSNSDALVTIFMMIAILIIEIVQFGIKIFSEWAKMSYICMYVRNECCQGNKFVEKLIELVCSINVREPWGGQLGQYSLLEKFSYHPPKVIYNCFTKAYIDQKRDGQDDISSTKLSKKVKKAIAQSLIDNGTSDLENGRASLVRNHVVDQLSWACNLESTSHVIMVWHIATHLCEEKCSQGQGENFNVATKLSKYLAYLVAFAPRLLPDHPCRSESIFCRAVREARDIFKGSSTGDKMIELMRITDDRTYCETIIYQGAQLGGQLLNLLEERQLSIGRQLLHERQLLESQLLNEAKEYIWKILADFWVEMMLYVAPSNDAEAHAKYLPTGGEFVTHLWVLLSHAGIRRKSRSSEQHDDMERRSPHGSEQHDLERRSPHGSDQHDDRERH